MAPCTVFVILSAHTVEGGWRQTLRKICVVLLLRNERSGSSPEIAKSRFQDRDEADLVTPCSVSSSFRFMPCNYLPCFSDTSLHFLRGSKIIVKLSPRWLARQKIISKSCPSNPLDLPPIVYPLN